MGIDKDKASIPKYIPPQGTVSNLKTSNKSSAENKAKEKSPKFISEDVKNYFSYNLKTDFKERSSKSKNSVTYDLKSFDEDKS